MATKLVNENEIRPPAVAGAFYPANLVQLAQQIDGYLAEAQRLEPEPSIIIVPHAGYVFSGGVAAHSFKQALDRGYASVIILGFNHSYAYGFDGAAIWPSGAWHTPLGDVSIDAALAQRILEADPKIFNTDRSIHLDEHSLEVQVPFIQRVLPGVPIVPISIGRPTLENVQAIADALAQVLRTAPKTLVVTSTDLSHYPRYQDAVRVDHSSINAVISLDPLALDAWDEEAMSGRTPNLHTTMCGKGPVMVSMLLARNIGAEQVNLIHYANSGDVPEGEHGRVVGYAAIEFVKGHPPALEADDKAALLQLARRTLDEYLSTRTRPHYDTTSVAQQQPRATFVTLRHKHSYELRGCRGEVFARYPLWESVQHVSILSATDDPRFRPMTHDELADMHIEISVLTPMRLARGPEEVIVGKHGVMIRKGGHGGLFLPQVPEEQGWDRDEYLSTLCWMKAGLPVDAWRKPGTQLYIFEAEVFEE
ncbi:MAG TPA: AmmeMemoRadiSam system protein B [Anaerolineae bacterium]|nr:AmmeMemoRadiSam system protein B [Anaerolineae bacterium]